MQSAKHIVTIPEPCSENWAEMTPVERGRFCASCQKTVVDLSCSSDSEVVDFFKRSAGATSCVRFHNSQIGRELTVVKRPSFSVSLLKKIAASLILFQGTVTTAWAQKVKTPATQHAKKASNPEDKNRKIIKGTVIDNATSQMLGGMVVSIAGTEFKTTTAKDGSFRIVLPDSFVASSVTLAAGYCRGTGPQGTMMMDEVVSWEDVLQGREVVLHRYPKDAKPAVIVQGYRPVHHLAGVPVHRVTTFVVTEQPKKTTLQKITSPFRKKKKDKE